MSVLGVLAARVRGVNRCHKFANELRPKLQAAFAPLVGQQFYKAGGGITKKFQTVIDDLDLPGEDSLHVYRHVSNYSLAFTVKTCETFDGIGYYHEATIYVGEIANNVLVKLNHQGSFRDDYSVKEVQEIRSNYKKAEAAFEEARSKLFPFGEYDR